MKRAFGAYFFASVVSIPFGLVTSYLAWDVFKVNVPNHIAILSAWLVCAGLPSVLWSNQNLARALGVRRQVVPELRVVGQREISVLADAARLILPRRVMTMPIELEFRYGDVLVGEAEMLDFLRGGWRRQLRGDAPLSRNYWCGSRRMDRGEYEARVALLCACNLVQGHRRAGSRNRLRWPPLQTMKELKYRYLA